jgi:hypothetical protein
MLADFPNLDIDLTNSSSPFRNVLGYTPTLGQNLKCDSSLSQSHTNSSIEYREGAAHITEYSPEWSYSEGGTKVLVAGPWHLTAFPYTILFDGVAVPTSMVQSGVLRCHSPPHEPGFVTLQVACEGCVISNCVIFEYREHPVVPDQKTEDYFSVDGMNLCILFSFIKLGDITYTFSSYR